MNINELKTIIANHENEVVELKEWKNAIPFDGKNEFKNRKCLLGYCVALGNEGGGLLIAGVDNQGEMVGTDAAIDFNNTKKKIFDATGQKIEIEEIYDDHQNRLLIFTIPGRHVGTTFKFAGVPLMRVGESLEVMTDDEHRKILQETSTDFSAQIVPNATIQDLDEPALGIFAEMYNQRHKTNTNAKQLLQDLGLTQGKNITYAALVLVGKSTSLRSLLGNSEIIFQYRNNKNTIEYHDRVDYRKAFVLTQAELWQKIASRNQITQIQEGFLTREILSFNEKVIKEGILNAVAHRDYRDTGSITIKQSPEEIEIQSPGGFMSGITIQNVLTQSKPRNRLITEVLQHLGFVQRAGQGMDTIFQETIREGKGLPDLSASDTYQVTLKISAQVKNPEFLKFLERVTNEKQVVLSLDDILKLQDIELQKNKFTKEDVQKFLDLGIVEKIGRTRGANYILSHQYYKSQSETGVHTRLIGISREAKKHLILEHLKRNKNGAVLDDFAAAFTETKRKDISNILQEMRKSGDITKEGYGRWAIWKLAIN